MQSTENQVQPFGRLRRGITASVIVGSLVVLPCLAASVPSWLDDAITNWNSAHPESQVRFVDIKDSFVWYDLDKSPELGHQQIRERVNKIVLDHGYTPVDDEEMVTTGKPPVTSGRVMQKKCWSRSFVMNIKAQANTKAVGDGESSGQRQRMLTSLVCDDTKTWWAAFRVAE